MSDPKTQIAQELDKSRRAREAAERNAAAGDHDTATNRLYYAALHAAKAVLVTEALEPKTHRGIKHLFALHFVTKGLLPDWCEPALSRLETERDLADYAAEYTVSPERYAQRRDECDRLMLEIERFLRSQGW